MKNNKNRIRDRGKSKPALREMQPKDNADAGMASGLHLGTHESGHEKGGKNV